jgi:hypothetical protein
MYKLITLSTLLFGLALAPVLGGRVEQPRDGLGQDDSPYVSNLAGYPTTDPTLDAEFGTCEWRCEACEPGLGCIQTCTEVGNCGSTCSVIARCDADYVWNEDSCSCVE